MFLYINKKSEIILNEIKQYEVTHIRLCNSSRLFKYFITTYTKSN